MTATTTTGNNPVGGLPGWYQFDVTPNVACTVTFTNPDPYDATTNPDG
jgi:hypothetical protein